MILLNSWTSTIIITTAIQVDQPNGNSQPVEKAGLAPKFTFKKVEIELLVYYSLIDHGINGRSCASGAWRKVWTRTKILSPNILYFVAILRFVAIYAFYKALNAWQVPIIKYTLDEGIEAIFLRLLIACQLCHPVTMLPNHFYPNLIFSTDCSTASEP